jgi:hypothetical protein
MPTIDLAYAPAHFGAMGEKLRVAAERGLVSAAARGVQVIQTQIIPSRSPQPVDRGIYRAGWRSSPTTGGAQITNNEPSAVLIEEGVRANNIRAGRVMVKALVEWAKRKGLQRLIATQSRVSFKAGKAVHTSTKVKGVTDEAIAWAIIGAMKRKGIFNRPGPGLGILRELVDKHLPNIVEEEITREIQKELG